MSMQYLCNINMYMRAGEFTTTENERTGLPGHVAYNLFTEFQRSIWRGLSSLLSQGYTLEDFPKGLEIITKQKRNIIAEFLNKMKNNKFSDCQSQVNMLSQAGINWPELEMIKRSLKVELS